MARISPPGGGPGAPQQQAAPPPPPSIIQIIATVAAKYGVPLNLALAIASQESGLNPYAVGDKGTSFGLYQLHEGGELGNNSSSWAFNPWNNAETALSQVASVMKAHPNADPGQIAAMAQRPADQASYAASIDSIIQTVNNAGGSPEEYFAKQQPEAAKPGEWGSANAGASYVSGGNAGGDSVNTALTKLEPGQISEALSQAGFAQGLINAVPELKSIFQQALAQMPSDPSAFSAWLGNTEAQIMNSQWFRTHSAAQRQAQDLMNSDPGEYNRKVAQTTADLASQATAMGVYVSPAQLHRLAEQVMWNGLDQSEQTQALAGMFKYVGNGMTGQGGQDILDLQQLASQYYVPTTNSQLTSLAQRMMIGGMNQQQVQDFFKQQAISLFPQLTQQLNSGQTVLDVATPYMQQMAKTLEMDPNGINPTDPMVMKALQAKSQNGDPTLMPLWQFQETLRQDPRWLKTDNARSDLMGATTSLLQNMGLIAPGVSVGNNTGTVSLGG